MSPDELLILERLAWFNLLDPIHKAKLGSAVAVQEIASGEVLYHQGCPKEYIHCLIRGCISESDDLNLLQVDSSKSSVWDISSLVKSNKIRQGFLFSEVYNISNQSYESTVLCETDSQLLKIDSVIFDDLIKDLPELRHKILLSIVLKDQTIFTSEKANLQSEKEANNSIWKSWLLVIALPLAVSILLKKISPELNLDQIAFIGIFVAALTLWISEIVPLFAPALLILSALSLLSIAPNEVVLSGFSSQTFLFMVGLYTIGSLIKESGLAYRICLKILSWIPPSQEFVATALFGIGLLLNPILPSATARSSIVSPLLIDMKQNLKISDQSKTYSSMALSAYMGITTFSFVFLSAKSENLILYALLPSQTRDAYGYISWLINSLLVAVPLLIMVIMIWRIRFGKQKPSRITKETIQDQLLLLGKYSYSEIQAIACVSIFLMGSITVALHGISMAWISILIFCYLMLSGAVNGKSIKTSVDWQFLLFLAAIIGLSNSIPYSGFDTILVHSLSAFEATAASNMYLFVLVLTLLIYGLRFVLPPKLCAPLLATIFMPIFENLGINPWYFCIMCLILCDSAFIPYQHATLANFLSEINSNSTLNKKEFFQVNALVNCCKIIAIMFAIFVWKISGTL